MKHQIYIWGSSTNTVEIKGATMIYFVLGMSLLALGSSLSIVTPRDTLDENMLSLHYSQGPDKKYCGKLDCPDYVVVNKTDDYELRHYKSSKWVATEESGIDYKDAASKNFWKLFAYISGDNEKKVKIPMTKPVITRIKVSQGPFCESDYLMHFFVPHSLQKDTPKPTSPKVKLVEYPETFVYVRSFGGFSTLEKLQKNGAKLYAALQKENIPYDDSEYLYAGYDGPYKLTNRHNEIMVLKK